MANLRERAVDPEMSRVYMQPDAVLLADSVNVFNLINRQCRSCPYCANKNCWNQATLDVSFNKTFNPINAHWILVWKGNCLLRNFLCFEVWKLYCSFYCNIALSSTVPYKLIYLISFFHFLKFCLKTRVHETFTCCWKHDSVAMESLRNVEKVL